MAKRICVAGAGPGGLLLGKELAKAGMDVMIFEKAKEEDYFNKYDWTDALELCILKDAGLPVPFAKGNRWYGQGVIGENSGIDLYQPYRPSELGIYSPDYSTKTTNDVDFRFVMTNRTALQKYQTEQTLEAGATIVYGHNIIDLLGDKGKTLDDISVKGIVVESDKGREELEFDLVIDATGQSASLRSMLEPKEISQPFNANQYGIVYRSIKRVDTTDVDAMEFDWEHPPFRHHYRLRTPKGYIFFHPHDDTHVDVGGGAVTEEEIKGSVNDIFLKLPGVHEETGRAFEKNIKCLPPDALVATGFMVIGHAAGQVHPTHGCGISTAYMGALLAAQIIKKAKIFDIVTLWEYAYRWMSSMGAHFAALFHRLKNLEAEEVAFLIDNDITNGETTTNDYNGNYLPPNINEERRLEDIYPKNPDLIEKWMCADEDAKRDFAHYKEYPAHWNAFALARWRSAAMNK